MALFSGGLDSQLAVCVLREQGVDVHGVVFDSPFFSPDVARIAAHAIGIPLHIVGFSRDIVGLLDKPKHGFGSCMNPCIDCHALMLRRAGELMEERGFRFLATGEVLNERPMSQNRRSLEAVARESGYPDLVLRPLSARLLPETMPELKGWVDRAKLLTLEGRGRKAQLRLAAHYGLTDFPTPAGGCRLTEPNFCKRLKDLKEHEGLNGVRSITLLRFGRHFRFGDNIKLIVGRNEDDNAYLEGTAELYDLVLKLESIPGPTGLIPITASEDQILRAAAICARYANSGQDAAVVVKVRSTRGIRRVQVKPAPGDEIEKLRI